MSAAHVPALDPADTPLFPARRITNLALLAALAFAALALARYRTFHNETFDLAFYVRLVWGLGHGDRYQPLLNTDLLGLHFSPLLTVLGLLGRVFPIVPLVLVLQSVFVCAAVVPLARIAVRRAGHPFAADVTLVAYLLSPAIAQSATYEFHPSTFALFPLALALDAFDRRAIRAGILALFAAALCREDVALVAAFTGLALAVRRPYRLVGLCVFAVGVAWFATYLFVVAPKYLPRRGSLVLHYGALGGTPASILHTLLAHPLASLRLVSSPAKLFYAPRLLATVAFLPLFAPRWLLPALVPFAINFLSAFPTAVQLQSHYSLLVLPFLFASAAHGAGRLAVRSVPYAYPALTVAGALVVCASLRAQHLGGALPLSRRWDARAFRRDGRTRDLEVLLARVPPGESAIAPDHALAHVAERPLVQRIPWTREFDHLVLPVEYRHETRFAGRQELWRSEQEVLVRNVLGDTRYGLEAVAGDHLLLRHGLDVRTYARGRYVDCAPVEGTMREHVETGPSLAIAGWSVERAGGGGARVTVLLEPRVKLPADLGFELGWGELHALDDGRDEPAHTIAFLPFDGLFSPAHVHVDEVARTAVTVPVSADELRARGFYFGPRRIDGSRLDATGLHWVALAGAPPARVRR